MEKLRFKEAVFRLVAHLLDVVHIVKKIVKRDNAFPIIVPQVKKVDMVREKGFIHIQIADSLELILQNAFKFVVFLFSFPIIEKDTINVAGKSNSTASDPSIHPDEDGFIFNLQFQSDAVEEVSYQAKVHIGVKLCGPEPASLPSELLPVDHVDLFFENLIDRILSLVDNNVQKVKDFLLVTAGHPLTMTLPDPENVLGSHVLGGCYDRLVDVHSRQCKGPGDLVEEPPLVGGLYGEDALVILDALEPRYNFVLDDLVPLFPEEDFIFDVGVAPQNLLKGFKDHILEVTRIVFLRNPNSEKIVNNAFAIVDVRFQNVAVVYGQGSSHFAE